MKDRTRRISSFALAASAVVAFLFACDEDPRLAPGGGGGFISDDAADVAVVGEGGGEATTLDVADAGFDAMGICPPLKGTPPPATSCSRTFGLGIDRLLPSSVATDRDGNIIVTGSFYGSVDFGGGALTSAGEADGFLLKLDAQCNHVWSKRFGAESIEGGVAVATDNTGSIVLVASARGTVDFGTGALPAAVDGLPDIVVAKFDPCGTPSWSKRLGKNGPQTVRALAVDPSSGAMVVGGSFAGALDFGGGDLTGAVPGENAFIAKLDSAGKHEWSKSFGAVTSLSHTMTTGSLVLEPDGSVFATGLAQLTVDFGTGPIDFPQPQDGFGYWLARFDALGVAQAVSAANDVKADVVRSTSGQHFLYGSLSGPADFGTGPLTTDSGASFPTGFLLHLQSGALATDWVVPFGSDVPPRRFLRMRLAGRAGDVGLSVQCAGAVNLGGTEPCADGQHMFARYGLDGSFLGSQVVASGAVAVAPTNQYVIAGFKGDTAAAPEKMTITKLAP